MKPLSWCSTFSSRPRPVVNSSFLSAVPSPFVSVNFHTSSEFDSLVRIAFGPNGSDEPRKDQVIHEHLVGLVDAVVVFVFVDGNPPDGIELARGIGVLHVAAQLEDEHAPVAIERDLGRLFDVGIGEHELHLEAGRQAGISSPPPQAGAEGSAASSKNQAPSSMHRGLVPGPPGLPRRPGAAERQRHPGWLAATGTPG